MELAHFAIGQGQQMPERFKRDIQTFVADAVCDWAYAEYKAKRSPEPYLSDLLSLVDGEWELTEQIPAKYHKLVGLRAMEDKDWGLALLHFNRATELHPSIGVGVRVENCLRALKKQQAKPATE